MTRFRALIRKECVVLFASPVAYVVLTTVALLTAILFFEHLRLYNQQLFLYASSNMAGFDSSAIPDYINLRDTVFFPVMDLQADILQRDMGAEAPSQGAGLDVGALAGRVAGCRVFRGRVGDHGCGPNGLDVRTGFRTGFRTDFRTD